MRFSLRWLCLILLFLLTAAGAGRAADPPEIIIPLDEGKLKRLETLADHLTAKLKADPKLKADFKACGKDQKISGSNVAEFSASVSARHPRLTAALAADGWTPGDYYLTAGTLIGSLMAVQMGDPKAHDPNKGIERNDVFVRQHEARVQAVCERLGNAVED